MSSGTPAPSIALIPRSENDKGIEAMAGLAFGSPKFGSEIMLDVKSPNKPSDWTDHLGAHEALLGNLVLLYTGLPVLQ